MLDKWWSRDNMSAITLNQPGMCCEYSLASFSISCAANHLATLLCSAFKVEKEALCSHPGALKLSVRDIGLIGVSDWEIEIEMVMAAAISSSTLIEKRLIMLVGSRISLCD